MSLPFARLKDTSPLLPVQQSALANCTSANKKDHIFHESYKSNCKLMKMILTERYLSKTFHDATEL